MRLGLCLLLLLFLAACAAAPEPTITPAPSTTARPATATRAPTSRGGSETSPYTPTPTGTETVPPTFTPTRPAPSATAPQLSATPTANITPPPAPTFARTLKLTSPHTQGDDVLVLQQRLMALGYTEISQADGDFGAQTDAAVKRFQTVNALTADGIVGPMTWAALFNANALPAPTVVPGSFTRNLSLQSPPLEGEDVYALQERLFNLSYFNDCHGEGDPASLDGSFGPRTDAAVRRFQSTNGLLTDGIVGEQTWAMVFSPQAVMAPPASFAFAPLPPAPPPAQRGLIAFASTRAGNSEIYTISPDGLTLNRLTQNPADDFSPAWSPDGLRLAFISTRDGWPEIFVMNADGGAAQQLTCGHTYKMFPAWSPDGTRIAFTHGLGRADIAVLNLADGSIAPLISGEAWKPAWSPDGLRIAFHGERRYNQVADGEEIWLVNADGSNALPLSPNGYYAPDWSPDGTRLALASTDEIYVMNADGSGLTRLTLNASAHDPSWSPDGTRLAFSSMRGGAQRLWLINADGSNLIQLLNRQGGDDAEPDWQP